jgi:hypothetical protein
MGTPVRCTLHLTPRPHGSVESHDSDRRRVGPKELVSKSRANLRGDQCGTGCWATSCDVVRAQTPVAYSQLRSATPPNCPNIISTTLEAHAELTQTFMHKAETVFYVYGRSRFSDTYSDDLLPLGWRRRRPLPTTFEKDTFAHYIRTAGVEAKFSAHAELEDSVENV